MEVNDMKLIEKPCSHELVYGRLKRIILRKIDCESILNHTNSRSLEMLLATLQNTYTKKVSLEPKCYCLIWFQCDFLDMFVTGLTPNTQYERSLLLTLKQYYKRQSVESHT